MQKNCHIFGIQIHFKLYYLISANCNFCAFSSIHKCKSNRKALQEWEMFPFPKKRNLWHDKWSKKTRLQRKSHVIFHLFLKFYLPGKSLSCPNFFTNKSKKEKELKESNRFMNIWKFLFHNYLWLWSHQIILETIFYQFPERCFIIFLLLSKRLKKNNKKVINKKRWMINRFSLTFFVINHFFFFQIEANLKWKSLHL